MDFTETDGNPAFCLIQKLKMIKYHWITEVKVSLYKISLVVVLEFSKAGREGRVTFSNA